MFARLLWNLLRASRARLAVALVALISGAAVISALVNLDLDVERKLTQEFRTLGANMVVAPAYALAGTGASPMSPPLMDESVVQTIEAMRTPEVIAVAPFLYVVARARVGNSDLPVVVAGTWLDRIRRLEPSWKMTAGSIASREERNRCLVGRNVARQLGLAPGKGIELRYAGNSIVEIVAAVLEAGGPEDNQIFVNLAEAQGLLGSEQRIGLIQLSVEGSANKIESFANLLGKALPSLEVRPIRQIADAEGRLLDRIRLLIFTMVLLILVLTALCVLATMAALAMERREDVGLMKALGGSITRIVGLFLAEVAVLGACGGLLGYLAGIAISRWMGERVFGAAITPRLDVLPLTVALTVGIALAGAMPLRLLGKVRPAVILRGD